MRKFLLTALMFLTVPAAFAAPIVVGGSRAWNQDAAFILGEDAYQFSYTTGSALLKITQIDVVIGNGSSQTLFTDPSIGAPGFLTFGFGALGGSAAGGATITDPLADGDGFGSAQFSPGWLLGQDFIFSVDTDHTAPCGLLIVGCDFVTGSEFVDYGGVSFTLHFATTDPNFAIVGPSMLTIGNGGWTSVNNGLLPAQNSVAGAWTGTIDVQAAVPEPASMGMMGLGLVAVGLASRRWRK